MREVLDIDVVPLGETVPENEGGAFLEGQGNEIGHLAAPLVDGSPSDTVDGRRADDGDLDGLGIPGGLGEDDLVDVAMPCLVGYIVDDAVHAVEVVVRLLGQRCLAVALVLGVVPAEDARTANVDIVCGVGGRVRRGKAIGNGAGRPSVIRGVGGVC